MFTLKVENESSQVLTLTQNEDKYQVVKVDGVNPPEAEIYTNAVANMDGAKFKSSKLQMRNIVITVKVNGDVEENRLHLYEYFGTGKWCKLYYANGSRSVFIEGYCETIECDLFEMKQEAQISIVCPDPYFKALRELFVDISKVFAAFEFPFAIDAEGVEFSKLDRSREVNILNNGEAPCGFEITLKAEQTIVNPVVYNVLTGDYLKLNITMQAGNIIKISTIKGTKKIILINGATTTNIINKLEYGSTWFELKVGLNKFTYSATNEEFLKVEFKTNLLYEGV